jgi:hypothetical protein
LRATSPNIERPVSELNRQRFRPAHFLKQGETHEYRYCSHGTMDNHCHEWRN